MKYLIALILTICPVALFAATGDILYQNCTSASGCTGAKLDEDNKWERTVETTGCYSGECLKLEGRWNYQQNEYGAGNTSLSTGDAIEGQNSFTMTQWVKFSGDNINHANMKMIRAYNGIAPEGGSTPYFAGPVAPCYVGKGGDYYFAHSQGKLTPYNFDPVTEDDTYPGDVRYLIADPEVPGDYYWLDTFVGDITASEFNGFGSWNHFRVYTKLPTNIGGNDGEMMVWVNGILIFHTHDMNNTDTNATNEFTTMNFYPSSEADEPFEHWVDEMVVYEGYVPPSPPGSPELSNPLPAQTLSYGTTQTLLGVSTDTASTCKYSLTQGVAYSSMANTFSTTGGATHSQLLTGLTNGQSVPYYIKCDNGTEENTSDYIIYVAVDSGTCDDDLSFCDQTECESLEPTHYWWSNACHTASEPVGALSFGGTGTLSQQVGSGSLSQ